MKLKIFTGIALLSVAAVVVWFFFANEGNPYAAVDMIGNKVHNGKVVDFHQDIFNSEPTIDNVGRQLDNNGVYYIQFGKIEIKLPEEQLSNKTMLDKLKKIGIIIKRNKDTGAIQFRWNGEKMSQWVR